MYVGFDLLKQMWCLKHARKNHQNSRNSINIWIRIPFTLVRNRFWNEKFKNYSNIIPRTPANTTQMQYFYGAASESKLQVKIWLIAYRVDFWLMSCSSGPYSLLMTATNKYLQTESGDFKANEHKNNLTWSKVTDRTCSDMRKGEATQAKYRNLNWEKHHLPTLGILLVEPGRKKTLN